RAPADADGAEPMSARRRIADGAQRGFSSAFADSLARVGAKTSTKLCGAQPLAPPSRRRRIRVLSVGAARPRRLARRARTSGPQQPPKHKEAYYMPPSAMLPSNSRQLVFTSSQAARYLGVSLATIRRWTDSGHISCYRTPGGQRRFARSQLDDFISSMHRDGPAARAQAQDDAVHASARNRPGIRVA